MRLTLSRELLGIQPSPTVAQVHFSESNSYFLEDPGNPKACFGFSDSFS